MTAFAVAMAMLIVTPLAVVASDAFNDVPDSNVHHDDITWLADNGVTAGCNPPANDEFCPGDPVLRQQMASFMRRLAVNEVVNAATANQADQASEADHATEADHADSADDAATLGGMAPDAFAPAGGTMEIEPNDTIGSASTYPQSGPAQGGILGVAGVGVAGADYWRVDHPGGDFAAETRSFDNCADSSTGDTVITLFNANGDQLANDDDGGPQPFCSLIEMPDLPAGTYFVRVRSFGATDVYWYALMIRVNGQPLMAGTDLPPASATTDEQPKTK